MSSASLSGKRTPIPAADLRNILRWMFLLRVCLSSAIVLIAAFLWRDFFHARSTLVLLLFLLLSYVFTAFGYWRLRAGRFENASFLWLQLLHDLVFTTVVVVYTEGVGSPFSRLYIPQVAVASVIFGISGGALFAGAASTIFVLLGIYQREFASSFSFDAEYFPKLSAPEEPFLLNILLLVALFFLVALIMDFLRARLVTAGERVQALETEIRFITIDTRDILDSIESGVVSIDSAGRLAFINRKALDLLGIRLLTRDPEPVWQEITTRAPSLARLLLDTLDHKPAISRGELELDSPEGRHVPLGITTNLLYDEQGARRGVTAVFRDISHVKRMEELSRQRDRLAAVAELSASLAHEIKNPLASIRTSVELLASGDDVAGSGGGNGGDGLRWSARRSGGGGQGAARREEEEERLFRLIVKESDRLAKLLTDFLHFSRMELREEVPVPLRELLEEVVELQLLPAARNAATIGLEWLGLREPVVDGDFDLLKQLFQNVIANAVQAASEHGADAAVTIRVTRDYGERAEIYGLDPGQYVETRVIDNGPGIKPADLPRIFDPFFTTKPQGNGLGLAIVHRIVNVHGGALFVESKPGSGADFRVYLPLSSRRVRTRTRAKPRSHAPAPGA
ncbi:MAG: PAS domain S-box protein [Gemmatimonadetes bacterium]|nr:PAS domain S-box protein [Gemmatimonadota bacterium]